MLCGGTPAYGLTALTTTSARLLPADRLRTLLDTHPEVRAHVLAHLAQQVTVAQQQLVEAVALPGPARVAAWLHDRAPAGGVAWHGSQKHLGRLLGLSRVTVNRALARLTGQGAVRCTRRGVVVVGPARLATAARNEPVT